MKGAAHERLELLGVPVVHHRDWTEHRDLDGVDQLNDQREVAFDVAILFRESNEVEDREPLLACFGNMCVRGRRAGRWVDDFGGLAGRFRWTKVGVAAGG